MLYENESRYGLFEKIRVGGNGVEEGDLEVKTKPPKYTETAYSRIPFCYRWSPFTPAKEV